MNDHNSLRERLNRGEVCVGPFLKLTDPAIIEMVALAGYSHAVIDLEHGPISIERAQDLVRAGMLRGLAPLVRVSANEPSAILRALDIGAAGVHVPHVASAAEARAAIRACYFHPDGERGVCRYVRAADYTHKNCDRHFREANAEIVPVLHVEGVEGLNALAEILAQAEGAVIFLGPYDLSQSCGVPGQVDHPRVVRAMQEAVRMAAEHNVAVGTFVDNPEAARAWIGRGVRYICMSVDVGIFMDNLRTMRGQVFTRGE